ncbi:MAG: FecR domain-containing protein, partial [Omnitrophica WOR_2 bacterium]
MADLDEKLQEYINEVERGAPLDSVLNKIPATNSELVQLVHLAASVRSMNHPQPDKEHHFYQLEKILRASREVPTRPVWPTRAPSRSRKVNHGWRGHWALYPSITGIAILILFIAVTFAGAGVWLSGPPGSHYATIINVSGNVTISANPKKDNWQQVASGEKAYSSAVLRTGENSTATLIFFDGTRMDIGPYAELALTGIHGGWGNILSVQLDQKDGYTSYNVVPLHGNNSKFIVNTPAGTASVRGTHFTVDVSKNGQARF